MLKLRPYKSCDAKTILSWCNDEISFRKWTADRYDKFPITTEDMNTKYLEMNGDCAEEDNFYPFTAFDENGIVGHLIMRYTDIEKQTLRFGFIIVDADKRGKGYGKQMLKSALKYAFEVFNAKKVTLGVFDNNPLAFYCYKAIGFKEIKDYEKTICELCGEQWSITELEIDNKDYAK